MTTAVKLLDAVVGTKRRGLGELEVQSKASKIKLPLKSVDITGRVADRLAHVTVKQTFTNPYKESLEAVYIFPLSGGCAVSSFEMKVGDRVIKGKVDERQAARAEYAQALQDGKKTALLEQERENVFTVQVGNISPDEIVSVVLTYSEKLAYFEDGTTEIRLPLVVAPRFTPGQPTGTSVGDGIELDTDQVPDASRISPPRLAPGVNSQVQLGLKVILEPNQMVEDLECSQHATKLGMSSDGMTVALSREDELLNRDFVLRWRIATDKVQSKFLVFQNPDARDDCYGMISVVPPKCTDVVTAPRDVIFVVDRSGSMQGIKMISAARACSYLLTTLTPRDRFAIQAFDDRTEWMQVAGCSDRFVDADESGIQEEMDYLRTITARGGTQMDFAFADTFPTMNQRKTTVARQAVVVVLTDGEVANEAMLLAAIQKELGDIRVFTIGIDTAVNDGFLRKVAAIGGGTCSFVQPGTNLEQALSQVSREIGTPLIDDLKLEQVNCKFDADSLAPSKIPDIFEGRAVVSFFKISGDSVKEIADAKIRVKGQFADRTPFSQELKAEITDIAALPQLWAKTHLVDLEDEYRISLDSKKKELHKKMVDIAVAHSILTKLTAFVVVDESEVVNKDGTRRKIVQPVQAPALWEMEMDGAAAAGVARGAAIGQAMNMPLTYGGGGSWGAAPAAKYGAAPRPTSSPAPSSPPAGLFSSLGDDDQAALGFCPATGGPSQGTLWDCPSPPPAESLGAAGPSQPMRARMGGAPTGGAANADSLGGRQEPPQTPTNAAEIKLALERLEKILSECFLKLESGEVPDGEALDEMRISLLATLAKSSLASTLPELQKYLRSELVKFIAAIVGATTINDKLKSMSRAQQKTFASMQKETAECLEASTEKPFWTSAV